MDLRDKILKLLYSNHSELKELYYSLDNLRYAYDYGYTNDDEEAWGIEDKIASIENRIKEQSLDSIDELIKLIS